MGHQLNAHTADGFIPVTGGRVWYRIVGADRQRVPLLVLHGGPGAPHDYLETLAALADERPVVFYDQLGCGNSDRPADVGLWTVARFVDELGRVRAALGLETVHLLGQSWGTLLAAEYVLERQPTGIAGLVFSGPFFSARRWMADQRGWVAQLPLPVQRTIADCERDGAFASPAYQEAMMLFYRRHVCRLEPWPDCLNRTMEKLGLDVYGHMAGPSEFTLTGVLKDVERSDDLGRLKGPVLFTCGEFDEATPATTAHYQSRLPGAEIHVFQGASHEHHLEKPAEYMQVVRDFLRRAEAAR
jgi:proline iminopeptidase